MTTTTAEPSTRTQRRIAENITSRADPPFWWAAVQITAIASHVPLTVLSGPQRAVASVSSVLGVLIGVSFLFLVAYAVLSRLMRSGWRALALVSTAAVLFWQGSGLQGSRVLGTILTIALTALILAAAVRFSDRHWFKLVTMLISMTVAGTLLALVVSASIRTPDPVVQIRNPIPEVSLLSRPDIYLIVLDGYGRQDVLREMYHFDNSEFLDGLEDAGFEVADSSTTNYTITHLSIPSMLNMSYMNEPNDYMSNSDLEALAVMASGENALVETLKNEGYEYVHGDTDSWFNQCGPRVDICLPGPSLDVTMHTLLEGTPLGPLLYPKSGDPTTALNVERIGQMTDWQSQDVGKGNAPRFTFLHLVLPHPPLFLDSTCSVRIDQELGGRILNDGQFTSAQLDKRMAAWVEQVECANRTILEFVEELPDDAVVVVVSDHGPDLRFKFTTADPNDLTADVLAERLPNLTAVKLPENCAGGVSEDVTLVNVFRVVLSCLSGGEIPMLNNRHFAASFGGYIVELKVADSSAD